MEEHASSIVLSFVRICGIPDTFGALCYALSEPAMDIIVAQLMSIAGMLHGPIRDIN